MTYMSENQMAAAALGPGLEGKPSTVPFPPPWEAATVQQSLTATPCKAVDLGKNPMCSEVDPIAPGLQIRKTWMMLWPDNTAHGLCQGPQAPLSRAVSSPSAGRWVWLEL